MKASHVSKKGWVFVALEMIAIVSSVTVAIALLYLVVSRYWAVLPDGGMHTIALIAAMWLYMTGALLASYSGDHLSVDILSQQISQAKTKAWHQLLVSLITLFITALFLYWTYRMFSWGARFSTTMPASSIPIWVPQLAIGMNALGSFCFALRDVLQSIKTLRIKGS